MELRHLRYFLAVADTRSFTRAAERLGIAQPPLSRQIQQLESELGTPLFLRGRRPVELTVAGRFFFEQAQQINERLEEVAAATRRMGESGFGFFVVGFVGSVLYGPLPGAIRKFRAAMPDIEVGLLEMTTIQQREALKAGRIDIGFGRLDLGEDPEITREILVDEPLVVAVPADHPFVRREAVSLAEVASEALILYPEKPRPSFADLVLGIFRSRGLAPRVVKEVAEVQAAVGLVAAGLGIAPVPASVSRMRRDDIAYIGLDDPSVTSRVILSYRSADRSRALTTFTDLARQSSE